MLGKFCLIFIIFKTIVCRGQECGGVLDPANYLVTNPGYPSADDPESKYPPNLDCKWHYDGDADNTLIVVKFWDLVIEIGENNSNITCDYDFVNVSITSIESRKYCGWTKPEEPIRGVGSLFVHFHSDDSVNFRGFQVTFSVDDEFNPCDPDPCELGECGRTDDKLDPLCQCYPGITGENCDVDIQECNSNPCQNGGSCDEPEKDLYVCLCTPKWQGTNCDMEKGSPCLNDPCVNGGLCTTTETLDYLCECEEGYIGRNCETDDFPPCLSTPCQNEGTCRNLDNPALAVAADNEYVSAFLGYHCACLPGYDDSICETEIGCGNPGISRIESRKRFNHGSIIEFSCNDGFILQGSENLTCNQEGSWSEKVPECIEERLALGGNSLSPWSWAMIILGVALSTNIVAFTLWMVYKEPWVKRLPVASMSQSESKDQINSVSVSVSVLDDDVFEEEQRDVTSLSTH